MFATEFRPAASDIDENGHVNNVVYLDWAQRLATAHWRARARPEDQAAFAWVALRHEVDYRRALLPGETAQARTWTAAEADGPRFDRYVRIDGPDGAMCAQVRTTWVLVERPGGRPRRVPERMAALFA